MSCKPVNVLEALPSKIQGANRQTLAAIVKILVSQRLGRLGAASRAAAGAVTAPGILAGITGVLSDEAG